MNRLRISADAPPDPAVLAEAIEVLAGGGVLAYPTDTVYALGCDPRLSAALQKMFELKRRHPSHRVPFVAADVIQVSLLARVSGTLARVLADTFWPGPLTLVLPLREDAPLSPAWEWGRSIAVRVPASAPARALASGLSLPLPATSANPSGERAVSDLADLDSALLKTIDLVLDAGPLPLRPASTLVDLTPAGPRILRAGAVPSALLEKYLASSSPAPTAGAPAPGRGSRRKA
jgi:L-threonylcarbamoyladenylate synthase